MILLALILTVSSALADSRGGLSYTISGAAVQAPQFVPGVIAIPVLACGGMGAVVVPDEGASVATRRWSLGTLDCVNGVTRYTELVGGVGGQWGGRHVYLTASLLPGFHYYEQYHGGRMYEDLGITARAQTALGITAGDISLEVGPSLSMSAPLVTYHTRQPAQGRFGGSVSIEATFIAGNVSPRR